MKRETLEKYQVVVYLAAIALGLLVGSLAQESISPLELILWPLLGLLLYTTFVQVPLRHIRDAFGDRRFLAAAVVGNFLVVPVIVWCLLQLLPDRPAIQLGVLLVLLVPCTDWFITFSHLGKGDTKYAIAFSPVSLLLQIALLPLYLWLFLGTDFTMTIARPELFLAFGGLIGLPLLGAYLTERWIETSRRKGVLERLGWFPVPLLGAVVFVIAATQVSLVLASLDVLGLLILVYLAYLIAAALGARLLGGVFSLPPAQGRVLAFSMGTRNSFVVLPLALALPASWELAVIAIVFQSLVELLGMVFYLWWIPGRLFPTATRSAYPDVEG